MANNMLKEVQKALNQTGPTEATLQLPDVIMKTAACLGVAIIAAVPGWMFLSGSIAIYLGLLIVSLFLGITLARRAPIGAAPALGYFVVLGLIVGAFSHAATAGGMAEVVQAVIGTVAGALGMLLVYSTPWGKRAGGAVKYFAAAFLGYFIISIMSVIAALFGVGGGWGFQGMGPLGLALCAIGVLLACWSLLVDFKMIDAAIERGAPEKWSWSLGMSLASSIIWLYMELVRIIGITR